MTHEHHDHHHEHAVGVRAAVKEIFAPHSHDASDSIDGALESSAAAFGRSRSVFSHSRPRLSCNSRSSGSPDRSH